MSSGRIADLTAPSGENASYHLEFRAPQLKCSEVVKNVTNVTVMRSIHGYGFVEFNATVFSTTWNKNDSFNLVQERFLGYFTTKLNSTHNTVGRISEFRTLSCQPQSALYNLNIFYVKGVQQSSFSIKDIKPFNLDRNGCFWVFDPPDYTAASCNTDADSGIISAAQNISLGDLKRTLESWNVFAPLDAMLQDMQYNYTISIAPLIVPAGNFTLENGTVVTLKEISSRPLSRC